MPASDLPRYLSAFDAAVLKERIDAAVRAVRREFLEKGAEPRGLDHELGIALARAACRFDLDLLSGADAKLERLEATVAAMGSQLELAKMAASTLADHVGGASRREALAMIDPSLAAELEATPKADPE